MLDLAGKTLLERVVLQARRSNLLDEIWVATSTDKEDDVIENHAVEYGYNIFRGPKDDVLKRFCLCIEKTNAQIVVRVTADNPLTEVKFIEFGIAYILFAGCDYVGFKNIPYGSGVEIVKSDALLMADRLATSSNDREHVTPYLLSHRNDFNVHIIEAPWDELARPDIRATIDTMEDYLRLKEFFSFGQQKDSLTDYINFIDQSKK